MDFSYFYEGNRLKSMDRNGGTANPLSTHYQYDENGNMKRDEYLAANVYYNKLNLPKKVSFDDGRKLEYTYDAAGVKRRLLRFNSDRTHVDTIDYAGSIIYKNGIFDYLLTGEGRVTNPTGGFVYEYHLKDHLGNTRVAFEATAGEAIVKQQSDYYPFGLRFTGYLNNDNKYLYNGKELQDDTDWLDYGARMYDAQLGRWHVVDNSAETYFGKTPYMYSMNNPIRFVDPDGNDGWDVVKGIVAAISDNAALGLTNNREMTSYNNGSHYNLGQDIGDALSILLGAGEVAGGATIATGGAVATVGTGGAGGVVGVPAAGAGAAIATHGAAVTGTATANLLTQKGRVDESSGNNRKGGGKNAQHKNQKQKDVAKTKYEQAQKDYNNLKSKPNKTKTDKKQLQKLMNQRDNYKRKMDDTGENHSRNAKGNR